MESSIVHKEGFLHKKAALGIKKSWKKRYFRLYGEIRKLSYYHSEKESEIGYIDLSEATSVIVGGLSGEKNKKNLFTFRIITPNRLWLLRAESAKDSKDWAAVIEKFLSKRSTNPTIDTPISLNTSTASIHNNNSPVSLPSGPSKFIGNRGTTFKKGASMDEKKKTIQGKIKLKAISSFEATEPNELSFKEGDVITLIEEIDSEDWRGDLNGVIGVFPRTFVRPLEEEETIQVQQMIEREFEKQIKEEIDDQDSIISTSQQSSLKFSQALLFEFEAVIFKTENGIQVCKDIAEFFKKRSQIEEEYAKKLNNLCKLTSGGFFSKEQSLFKESKTLQDVFISFLQNGSQEAQNRLEFSQQLSKDLARALDVWEKSKEIERKKLSLIGHKHIKTVADSKNLALKNREIYEKNLREQEILKSEITKGEEEEKKLNKMTTKLTQTQEKSKLLEQNFKTSVAKANEEVDKFEKEHMPILMDKLQKWEEDRWNKLLGSALRYQALLEPLPIHLLAHVKQSAAAIEAANLEMDLNEFVTSFKNPRKNAQNEKLSNDLPPSPPGYTSSINSSPLVRRESGSNPVSTSPSIVLDEEPQQDNLIHQILTDHSNQIKKEKTESRNLTEDKVSTKNPTELLNEGLSNILKFLETAQSEIG